MEFVNEKAVIAGALDRVKSIEYKKMSGRRPPNGDAFRNNKEDTHRTLSQGTCAACAWAIASL
jgi:hypothetical protein